MENPVKNWWFWGQSILGNLHFGIVTLTNMIPVTCIEVVIIDFILSRWNVPIHRSITIFLGTPIQNRASLSQGTLKPWHILCDEGANLLWKGGKKSPAVPAVGQYQVQSHGRDGWTPCAAADCIKHLPKRWYFLWYWSPYGSMSKPCTPGEHQNSW